MKTTFRIFTCIICLFCTFSMLSAKTTLTAEEQKAIEDTLNYRVYVTALTDSEAITALEEYRLTLLSEQNRRNFSEEIQLTLEAFIECEKMNYIQNLNLNDPTLKQIASEQYTILKNWIDAHPSETPNKWTYCAAADAFSWYLSFLPLTQILKEGTLSKKYYEEAIKQDKTLSYAYTGLGQWQYFAPAIGGGGKKKALSTFQTALSCAKTKSDLFNAHALLSQSLLEAGDKAGAEKELAEAEKVQPGSKRLALYRVLNQKGCCSFDYSADREKLSKQFGL